MYVCMCMYGCVWGCVMYGGVWGCVYVCLGGASMEKKVETAIDKKIEMVMARKERYLGQTDRQTDRQT